jgi:hypothetical protein
MNTQKMLMQLLAIAVIALTIAGFYFLSVAADTDVSISRDSRTPGLVAGLSCLALAVGLLVLGILTQRNRSDGP